MRTEMPVFEFEIYNSEVSDALRAGDSHKFFKDEWADTHFIEFSGHTVDEARRRAERARADAVAAHRELARLAVAG